MRFGPTRLTAAGLAVSFALSASPVVARPEPPRAGASALPVAAARPARAWLHLEVTRKAAWVGEALPVTVRAVFRDVEAVTLEGPPAFKSDAIFTSELSQEPQQTTEIVDGTRRLVAIWTGTITPAAVGPLALSVELPVRLRYHDAPQAFVAPEPPDDPFGVFNIDPTDPASFDRLFQSIDRSFSRGMLEPAGNAHDDASTLKTGAATLEVKPLPSAGQPRGFSGAVGRFELRASVPAAEPRVSEPITVTITVTGEGDLGRVELAGVPSSADLKAYPPSAKSEPRSTRKGTGKKTFEQVLVPERAGHVTLPPVELPVFDPIAGRYTTLTTAPLALEVAPGPAAATASSTPARPAAPGASAVPDHPGAVSAPTGTPLLPNPSSFAAPAKRVGLLLIFFMLSLAVALLWRAARRRLRSERSLCRTARRAAKRGSDAAFFAAARRWIVVHFSKRWGVPEEQVTADTLRARLGESAEPLATALTTADALRFGRRSVPPDKLAEVCSTIERSLKARHAEAA